jgi:hypothetical protein
MVFVLEDWGSLVTCEVYAEIYAVFMHMKSPIPPQKCKKAVHDQDQPLSRIHIAVVIWHPSKRGIFMVLMALLQDDCGTGSHKK